MTEEYFVDDSFRSQLDAESLLLMHMNRIAIYRDTDMKRYCSAVETLILLCPRRIRDRGINHMKELGLQRGMYSSITDDKRVVYDDLLIFINEELEKQRMIWKKKTTRTFE
jgi:hypothetical protein